VPATVTRPLTPTRWQIVGFWNDVTDENAAFAALFVGPACLLEAA
jgi:hypothetical protein